MSESYREVKLFGGAIVVKLPVIFTDASKIRQVPDTQEVYIQANGYTNFVIEILERVEGFNSDEAALNYHFEDLTSGDRMQVWAREQIMIAKLPPSTPAYTLMATNGSPSATPSPGPRKPVFTCIFMILVRLASVSTDLVVTINVPHYAGEFDATGINMERGSAGPLIEQAGKIRDEVVASLEIKDMGLFVN